MFDMVIVNRTKDKVDIFRVESSDHLIQGLRINHIIVIEEEQEFSS